jgi:hypothetical protein
VADHRQAVRLRDRLGKELLARAARRGEADDLDGAIADLKLAETHGAPPDLIASSRLQLAEKVAEELRLTLSAGDPARVLERTNALAKENVSGPTLRRLKEAAENWTQAQTESQKGEFARAREALDRSDRLMAGEAADAIASFRKVLEARQRDAQPRIERLYEALATGNRWGEILSAAESLLGTLPDHPAARQARARAWQQIGAINPAASIPARAPNPPRPTMRATEAEPRSKPGEPPSGIVFLDDAPSQEPQIRFSPVVAPSRSTDGLTGRALLWADAIGGYLLCFSPEIVLGRAGADSEADVPVLGDLSRRHASLLRQGDGYVIRAHHPTYVNGRQVVGVSPLRDRDVIRLGSTVEILFRQPSPVSSTARLEIVSRHRLPVAVDGVLLMAETCLIGPSPQSHVPAPDLETTVVLFRQNSTLWCRVPGSFEVDGRACSSRAALRPGSRVAGEGFSFSLEPLPAPGTSTA